MTGLGDIRLYEAIGRMRETADQLQEERDQLKAENAKLRELVQEIWRSCPVSEDDCAKCPHHIDESDEVWCDIPILMEKLGVEVDG